MTEPIEDKMENLTLTKEDIVANLKADLGVEISKEQIKKIETLKNSFYKIVKEEKAAAIEAANQMPVSEPEQSEGEETSEEVVATEEAAPVVDPVVEEFKSLFNAFKEKKDAFNKELLKTQKENATAKKAVIEELKALIEKEEVKGSTFEEYKAIQEKWNAIGEMTEEDSKEIWGDYNYQRELFYNKISIDRELRALDYAKNLEAKITLCEKVEALASEENIQKMNDMLQYCHEQWREIGPVGKEQNESIWERFQEASKVCHKKRQDYYDILHAEEAENLKAKTALCEKVEAVERQFEKRGDWEKKTKEILAIQEEWKGIGRVGKAENENIWNRFRAACDLFFNAKQEYYKGIDARQKENLAKKEELVKKAILIQDSENWKEATDQLIGYQKEWKAIGEVPFKVSEKIWKEFRGACDHFFDRKATFFASRKDEETKNLAEKEALIKEIEAFKLGEDRAANLEAVKTFSTKYNAIGHVPFKQKDKVYKSYKKALDEIYQNLDLEKNEKMMLEFKSKFGDIEGDGNATDKIKKETKFLKGKLRQLQEDLDSFDRNMLLISKSKSADLFRQEVEKNKKKTQRQMEDIKKKLDMLQELNK